MGKIADAYDAHAALTITGVRRNFALDDVPDAVSDGQLPCILPVLPAAGAADAQTVPTNAPSAHADLVYNPQFYVLVTRAGAERGLRTVQPKVLDVFEAYLLALREHSTLGGLLALDLVVNTPEFGTIDWPEGTSYNGFRVTHTWEFYIR